MNRLSSFLLFVFVLLCVQARAQQVSPSLPQNILFGTAYYSEYMPEDRLNTDIEMMRAAHFNVVRMGESTWDLWEPTDGQFEYAWMDRVVDAMGKAGIKVILGTPTYSVPVWLYANHPEIMVHPLGTPAPMTYGGRQNMDFDNPVFRRYAERLIRNLVRHYKDNPYVIGWQIDNETASYDAANEDVFQGFVAHLKDKFGTVENMNRAWFLNYWGQNVDSWQHMPPPTYANSTGYKLEWSRWQQMRVTAYLGWQASLVRQECGAHQFVTQDFANAMHSDVSEYAIARKLDIAATNSYHNTQDAMDGSEDSLVGDFVRSLKHANYLVTETNAQTTDWSSAFQFPPYDGQLRLNVYTHLASGANMVEYWHWHSIHAGQETYWKGVLAHDLKPNRAYSEIARTGKELEQIGDHLANLKIDNQVAILYSVDSANGLKAMPFTHSSPQWTPGSELATYFDLVRQFHKILYDMNVGVDFVYPEDPDFERYKLLIVPALYIADDSLLQKISHYVQHGGHVLMTFKSGFANENADVRWQMAPGPLQEVAGFHYQEFSNLKQSLALRGDPYHVGSANAVSYWAEFLIPDHAETLAFYDHPFFGQWPAVTRNHFGAGWLTYEGTWMSTELQHAVVRDELAGLHLLGCDQAVPPSVRVRSGVNRKGQHVFYYLNFSSESAKVQYGHGQGVSLLDHATFAKDSSFDLAPWGVEIIEESVKDAR